ncbi:MAG: AAA family ATPase [Candidatus Kaelpia imicola]|nr:AAA family ATPase [Candidatus Kaelpia imicola]
MIIAISNQKGGVGKTTTAINLSTALASKSAGRVLLVDFDPQANATSGIGITKAELSKSIYDFIHLDVTEEVILKTAIPNLFLLPSTIGLCGAEIELIESEEREFKLKNRITTISSQYDHIIIDTPPSLGILTINALVASERVIIPIQCEYYALEGLVDFLGTLNLIKDRLNPSLDILGILLTMADYRTNIARDVEEEIRNNFKDQVFHTVIHRNVRLAEAPSYGLPIELYDSKSVGALLYRELVDEVLLRMGGVYGKEERSGQGNISSYTGEESQGFQPL